MQSRRRNPKGSKDRLPDVESTLSPSGKRSQDSPALGPGRWAEPSAQMKKSPRKLKIMNSLILKPFSWRVGFRFPFKMKRKLSCLLLLEGESIYRFQTLQVVVTTRDIHDTQSDSWEIFHPMCDLVRLGKSWLGKINK